MSASRAGERSIGLLFALAAGFVLQACAERDSQTAMAAPKMILIIGDGMDDQQITIARNFLVGSDGRLTLDGMPYRGAAQVQTVAEQDPARPVYVADSANTATSMATGRVTSRGRIATAAGSDDDLITIMELAHMAGLGTGIVTTSSVTDATPAAFVAHVNQRFCENPGRMVWTFRALNMAVDCSGDFKQNGGRGSIAEQIAASTLDIVLGGGRRHFEQPAEGETAATVVDRARANGYAVLFAANGLEELPRDRKILGLFADNTMPVRLRGIDEAQARPLETVDGRVQMPEPIGCEPNPEFDGVPSLAEMTRAALDYLDAGNGFMLMIESASIDKQSHLRRPCGHIGELNQLDEALATALDYGAGHPETLVLVTADHTHAAQIISETSEFLRSNHATPGYFARLRTPEGGIMGINYATTDSPMQEVHTGGQVPVYASGPGAAELPIFMHQSDIFGVSLRHLGISAHSP